MPPTSRSVAGGPGLPLDHLGEQRQPDRDHLAILGQPGDGLAQEGFLLRGPVPMAVGQFPVGSAEGGQDLAGVPQVEEIDEGDVRVRFQVDLQVAHEPAGGQPEVVPDQHDRLDVLAVALPQGGDQLGVLLALPGEEPLLELVEDQEHLLARAERPPPPQRGQGLDQAQPGAQLRGTPCAAP